MSTIGLHTRVASFIGAVAFLIQISPVQGHGRDHNRPVDITFTKWGVPAPAPPPAPQPPFGLLEGFTDDNPIGSYVGEVLWRQASFNGHVTGLTALYEVVDPNPQDRDGDRSFSALIRGGQNAAGAAHFDGVILSGWRAGARVQVVYQRYLANPTMASCEGAPVNKTCFVGTIHVERAPKD